MNVDNPATALCKRPRANEYKAKAKVPHLRPVGEGDATICKHCLGYLAPLPLPVAMRAAPRRSVSYARPPTARATRRPRVMVPGLACMAGVACVAALVGGIWWLRPTTAIQISVAAPARIAEIVTSGSANKMPFAVAPTVPVGSAPRPQACILSLFRCHGRDRARLYPALMS